MRLWAEVKAVIVLEQVVLQDALLNIPEMDDHLLLSFILCLPNEWIVAILLNDKFGVSHLILDMASILNDDLLHLLNCILIKSLERLSSNCKGATHENIFGDSVRSLLVLQCVY